MIRALKNEIGHVIPVFLFFFIAFVIINETESFLLKKAGLHPYSLLDLSIAAALIAKIFLVIDHLPTSRFFLKKPLIYLVAFKTLLYWFVAFIVRMGIRFFPYLYGNDGFSRESERFLNEVNWPLLVSVQCWYLMLFFLFVTSRELARVIGREKIRKIFFGRDRLQK